VIVRFVDIGEIIDHDCLKFLFMTTNETGTYNISICTC